MRELLRRIRQKHITAVLCVILLAVAIGLLRSTPPRDYTRDYIVIDGRPVQVQQAVFNIWVQIAIMIVSAIISYALTPKPPAPKPAALGDFDVPTAEEGRPIPVIFGTVWITGPNVLWYGDLRSTPIRSKGKK